jgi:YegS/Rv2252/BmrU family lipid kinase
MNKKTNIVFIINPVAGTKNRLNVREIIENNLSNNWKSIINETRYAGHAGELVLKYLAKGITYFVAVGGDGTVSEVAKAVFKANAKLGIIPMGSGNGLARSLNIPLKADQAVKCINQNHKKKIDVGTINNNFFFCTCGVGFDAHIGKKFAKQKKRGFGTYIKTTLKEYHRYKSKKYKLSIDGKKIRRHAFLVTVANAGQYGNNAYISPRAEIDDGILDLCIFKPFPLYKSIMLGIRLFAGNIDRSKYLETIQGRTIVFRKNKKYQFHIDGDPVKLKGPVHIDIIPKALKVIVP